jgi:hypothetical protein
MSKCPYCLRQLYSDKSTCLESLFRPFDQHNQHHCHHHKHDKHNDCRRDICERDFKLRLGGLQNGMNFRLRQLIDCKVKMELEGDKTILAEICFVGSNYVEVNVIKEIVASEGDNEEADVQLDDVDSKMVNEKKKATLGKEMRTKKENTPKKCRTWIIKTEHINYICLPSDCECLCKHD